MKNQKRLFAIEPFRGKSITIGWVGEWESIFALAIIAKEGIKFNKKIDTKPMIVDVPKQLSEKTTDGEIKTQKCRKVISNQVERTKWTRKCQKFTDRDISRSIHLWGVAFKKEVKYIPNCPQQCSTHLGYVQPSQKGRGFYWKAFGQQWENTGQRVVPRTLKTAKWLVLLVEK